MMFYWLFHVTAWFSAIAAVGILLLLGYLSLYYGLFALLFSYFKDQSLSVRLFLIPAVWVSLEFVREYLFTGFGWGTLGGSQYRNLLMIQSAEFTGVFGVSYLVCLINYYGLLVPKLYSKNNTYSPIRCIFYFLLILNLGFGFMRLNQKVSKPQFKAALIQGNVEQDLKWEFQEWPRILKQYIRLTRAAVNAKPDLVIWPETSFPGILGEDDEFLPQLKKLAVELQVPLLFGAIVKEDEQYYNSALLISKEGDIVNRYDKSHLVAFGEYLPLRSLLPGWLKELIPILDFKSGDGPKLFKQGTAGLYAVLICFEDTVARVVRQSVAQGAGVLVNLTNDAWFKDSKAPYMHLQASIFRSIENRRFLMRSTNTGVTGLIDDRGRILLPQLNRNTVFTNIDGYLIAYVAFSTQKTFYTKYGDIFAFLCLLYILIILVKKNQFKPFQ